MHYHHIPPLLFFLIVVVIVYSFAAVRDVRFAILTFHAAGSGGETRKLHTNAKVESAAFRSTVTRDVGAIETTEDTPVRNENRDTIMLPAYPDPTVQFMVTTSMGHSSAEIRTAGDTILLSECPATSQVGIVTSSSNESSSWILQSYDVEGNPKRVGGDEFYITWTAAGPESSSTESVRSLATTNGSAAALERKNDLNEYTAAAIVNDLQDGTYTLEFVIPPRLDGPKVQDDQLQQQQGRQQPRVEEEDEKAGGTLTVHLQYTCGMGTLPPPVKDSWKTGGTLRTTWRQYHTHAPPMRPFIPSQDAATSAAASDVVRHGVSSHNDTRTVTTSSSSLIDLDQHDRVFFFGDSLMEQLVRSARDGQFFLSRNQTRNRGNIWMEYSLKALPHLLRKLEHWHGDDLRQATPRTTWPQSSSPDHHVSSSVGLVLGSAVWDMLVPDNVQQGTNFADHLETCRTMIHEVQRRYPNVAIYWRSASAVHVHKVAVECDQIPKCNHRVRYMSSSRAYFLYQQQKSLMQELNVPFLDLYEAYHVSAHATNAGDGRHFQSNLNAHMLGWFYSKSKPTLPSSFTSTSQ